MRSFVTLFFAFSSFVASAAEPVTDTTAAIAAAKEQRDAAVATYRQQLEEARAVAETRRTAAVADCGEAKKAYLAAVGSIAVIDHDLEAVPENAVPELVATTEAYNRSLRDLRRANESQVKEAKKDAKKAGVVLSTANDDIARIDEQIAALEAPVKKKRIAACIQRCDDSHGSSSLNNTLCQDRCRRDGEDLSAFVPTIVDRASPSATSLPAEFAVCFPLEVKK